MEILFLSHYYPPEGNAPATRVSALARRWVASGHEVTVVTSAPNVPDGVVYAGYSNSLLPQERFEEGVRVIRVWTWIAPNRGTLRRIMNYGSYLVSAWLRVVLRRRPDILIATSPQFFCGWAGVLATWALRVRNPLAGRMPFVLEIRDLWPESIGAVDAIQSRPLFSILEKMEVPMYRAATGIVTVGPGYKRRLLERGVPEEKIEVIMNGVDRDLLEGEGGDASGLRRELGLEGKVVCSYLGTIGMACGLEVLLRAGRLLAERGRDEIVLLAIGDGAVRAELAEQVAAEGLTNVRFLGRKPKEEMPRYLALTDVCLVHLRKTPLFESVMPSKIFEAAGMRRPILNGVDGDAREFVERGDCGVCFEPENEVELVDRLCALADDAAERERLGENGYRFVCAHFDRDVLAGRYLNYLVAMAGSGGPTKRE